MVTPELRVIIARQTMEVWQHDRLICSYAVSTSKFGTGNQEGSFRTPLGIFEVCEKHGDGASLNTIFKGRKPEGEWNTQSSPVEEDLVLTRILRLHGLERQNENTYQRFIYIHGTNHEDTIGSAASHGCIRMRRADIAELYEIIPRGTRTRISIK